MGVRPKQQSPSHNLLVRAFSPLFPVAITSWGFAPGWYNIAPSALELKQNHGFLSTEGAALKAPSISAWGEAPGKRRPKGWG